LSNRTRPGPPAPAAARDLPAGRRCPSVTSRSCHKVCRPGTCGWLANAGRRPGGGHIPPILWKVGVTRRQPSPYFPARQRIPRGCDRPGAARRASAEGRTWSQRWTVVARASGGGAPSSATADPRHHAATLLAHEGPAACRLPRSSPSAQESCRRGRSGEHPRPGSPRIGGGTSVRGRRWADLRPERPPGELGRVPAVGSPAGYPLRHERSGRRPPAVHDAPHRLIDTPPLEPAHPKLRSMPTAGIAAWVGRLFRCGVRHCREVSQGQHGTPLATVGSPRPRSLP
jgi:hypothetical protein